LTISVAVAEKLKQYHEHNAHTQHVKYLLWSHRRRGADYTTYG